MSVSAQDLFLAKLDAAGKHVWSKSFGVTGIQFGTSVVVDGDGGPMVTGYGGTIDFGGGPLTTTANAAVFVGGV